MHYILDEIVIKAGIIHKLMLDISLAMMLLCTSTILYMGGRYYAAMCKLPLVYSFKTK